MNNSDMASSTSPTSCSWEVVPEAIPAPETYMPHALKLGLAPADGVATLHADSFADVRTRARHLAILCGFQVRMAKGSSNKRRVWICSSVSGCPFAVIAQQTKDGIHIRSKLQHNHPFHLQNQEGQRYTTATTHELACYVRESDVFKQAPDVAKITAKQISDAVFAHTGRRVKANRASAIKKLLIEQPQSLVPSAALFQSQSVPSSEAEDHTEESTQPAQSTENHQPLEPPPLKTMAEAVWDCFVFIANAPYTLERLGLARVRHMVLTYKQDRDTLRATMLMSCPRPHALPCLATNPPDTDQFIHHYLRQTELGFF